MLHFVIAIAASLCFAVGSVFFQLSEGMTKVLPMVSAYGLFALGASFQAMTAQDSGLGMTYVMIVGLEVVFAIAISMLFFQESFSLFKLSGIALIVLGVVAIHN